MHASRTCGVPTRIARGSEPGDVRPRPTPDEARRTISPEHGGYVIATRAIPRPIRRCHIEPVAHPEAPLVAVRLWQRSSVDRASE